MGEGEGNSHEKKYIFSCLLGSGIIHRISRLSNPLDGPGCTEEKVLLYVQNVLSKLKSILSTIISNTGVDRL